MTTYQIGKACQTKGLTPWGIGTKADGGTIVVARKCGVERGFAILHFGTGGEKRSMLMGLTKPEALKVYRTVVPKEVRELGN